ncbi:MAG: CstA-like transporter-associated (seleno)protein [Candidatus Acidiferrum sp.]
MRGSWDFARHKLARFWNGLREWCGDAAYERYRQCAVRQGRQPILSPSEFYVQQLNRKYSRPNRCC